VKTAKFAARPPECATMSKKIQTRRQRNTQTVRLSVH
jgi:hypothetical protein